MEGERRGVPLREFARLEGVTERTVRNWIGRGWLTYWRRPSGRYFIEGWREAGAKFPENSRNFLKEAERGGKKSATNPKSAVDEIGQWKNERHEEVSSPGGKRPGLLDSII